MPTYSSGNIVANLLLTMSNRFQRPPKQFLLGLIGLCALIIPTISVGIDDFDDLEEGTHYQLIEDGKRYSKKGEVEVAEVFLYSCPHCAQLYPKLKKFEEQLPEYANFHKLPAVFGTSQRTHAQLFWALELVTKGEDTPHGKVFDAIHYARSPMTSEESVRSFARQRDLEPDRLIAAMRSLKVRSDVQRAFRAQRDWQIAAVPTFVIDGQYLVTSTRDNGFNHDDLLETVLTIVDAVHKGKF